MSDAKAVKIKKVSPYPIPLAITTPGGVIQGKVLRLEVKGFIAETGGKLLKVGEFHQTHFELPVMKFTLAHKVRVIKIYDRPNETGGVERMAEFHFDQLSDEEKKKIYSFLRAIRQEDGP